jgi:hypothetical protein
MTTTLWARLEERADGTGALVLFRRDNVSTARGTSLSDIPVLLVEDDKGIFESVTEAVKLDLDLRTEADGSMVVMAKAQASMVKPVDPAPVLSKFDDKPRKVQRGMGKFLGKDSKPVSKGASPPVPSQQRVGGRKAGKHRVSRGGLRGSKGRP